MFSLKSFTILALTCAFANAVPSAVEKRAGTMSELIPLPYKKAWTVSSLNATHLTIGDDVFRPQKMIKALDPDYVVAPDNRKSMHAHFPKGSYDYKDPQGGISFYGPGPASVDLTTAKEATFGYTVYFPEGYDFVKGGKLPGLYGGDTDSGSVSCSGGRKVDNCFSARVMWRTDGAGEIYAYVPPYTDDGFSANKALCSVPPYSECNPDYGNSVGRGAFSFKAGTRTYISTRVKLNDAGKANGEFELWADGKSVISVGGIIIRDTSAGRIRGIQMQTFFGGNDDSWASPKDQDIYFADFSVAITETL